jgi:hypothetical protein
MIPASRFGGLNHVAAANLNAASAPIGMSASGLSGKYLLDQSITEFHPGADSYDRQSTQLREVHPP